MTNAPMKPFWVVVSNQTNCAHALNNGTWEKEIAAGTHRIVGPFTEPQTDLVAELRALKEFVDKLPITDSEISEKIDAILARAGGV